MCLLPNGASVVYHAFRGAGRTIIDGQTFEWSQGDFFVVPGWRWHEHENGSDSEEALLYSVNDAPALQALGLLRAESHPDGRQSP